MSDGAPFAVQLENRPLWRVRAGASLTRWLLYVTAVVGVAATVRFAVAPPRAPRPASATVAAADRAAEGFATLFTRRYLTWDAAMPTAHAQGLANFLGGAVDGDGGVGAPSHGSQGVTWAEVVQARDAGPGEHVYTVAADTGGATPVYLSVDVVRDGTGALRLGRYPALIGAPLTHPPDSLDGTGVDVTDAGVVVVVDRALHNYLDGSGQNLAADLAPGSLVATPPERLALDHVDQLRAARAGEVLATVAVHDAAGATYRLTYQLALLRSGGRWLVGGIQTDPRT